MSANGGQFAWTGGGERFGKTLNGAFARRRNLLSVPVWSMQRDVMRFNRQCLADSATRRLVAHARGVAVGAASICPADQSCCSAIPAFSATRSIRCRSITACARRNAGADDLRNRCRRPVAGCDISWPQTGLDESPPDCGILRLAVCDAEGDGGFHYEAGRLWLKGARLEPRPPRIPNPPAAGQVQPVPDLSG